MQLYASLALYLVFILHYLPDRTEESEMSHALIQPFWDATTSTFSYGVVDPVTQQAAIIDAVLDYEPASGRTSTTHADELMQWIQEHDYQLRWILETHAHADHVSAADYLKTQLGGQTGIGAQITEVQHVFKEIFQLESGFATDGRQFDRLLREGDVLGLGELSIRVLHVPGHTPADVAYQIDDVVFVGDTIFPPDVGTARCDFPGGNAQMLYQSVRRLLSLPDDTRLFMCHDYPPTDRPVRFECSVAEQRAHNIHVSDTITEAEFVGLRTTRDLGLSLPRLMLPAVQINIRAGALPPADAHGRRFLKIPLNAL